jgi:hypothetical protein
MGLSSIDSLTVHGRLCGIAPISPEDYQYADSIYREMWGKLDRTQTYSLHHRVFAAELLSRAGKYAYPEIKRFTGLKGKEYKDTIDLMWNTCFPPVTGGVLLDQGEGRDLRK